MCEICRRVFLSGIAAVGTAGVIPVAFAQGTSDTRFERPAITLPQRGEFVITNAYVITTDPQLGIPRWCMSEMERSSRSARADKLWPKLIGSE